MIKYWIHYFPGYKRVHPSDGLDEQILDTLFSWIQNVFTQALAWMNKSWIHYFPSYKRVHPSAGSDEQLLDGT